MERVIDFLHDLKNVKPHQYENVITWIFSVRLAGQFIFCLPRLHLLEGILICSSWERDYCDNFRIKKKNQIIGCYFLSSSKKQNMLIRNGLKKIPEEWGSHWDFSEPKHIDHVEFTKYIKFINKGRFILWVRQHSIYLFMFFHILPFFPQDIMEIPVLPKMKNKQINYSINDSMNK